ncbi:hypothetical protein C8R46DRAFT_1356332 [Mycena filopes]|nr:hypothetical protein C8R46DRAFT_1356332 [Mycena filopes]
MAFSPSPFELPKRAAVACSMCRESKVKCMSVSEARTGQPCMRCSMNGLVCEYVSTEKQRARSSKPKQPRKPRTRRRPSPSHELPTSNSPSNSNFSFNDNCMQTASYPGTGYCTCSSGSPTPSPSTPEFGAGCVQPIPTDSYYHDARFWTDAMPGPGHAMLEQYPVGNYPHPTTSWNASSWGGAFESWACICPPSEPCMCGGRYL